MELEEPELKEYASKTFFISILCICTIGIVFGFLMNTHLLNNYPSWIVLITFLAIFYVKLWTSQGTPHEMVIELSLLVWILNLWCLVSFQEWITPGLTDVMIFSTSITFPIFIVSLILWLKNLHHVELSIFHGSNYLKSIKNISTNLLVEFQEIIDTGITYCTENGKNRLILTNHDINQIHKEFNWIYSPFNNINDWEQQGYYRSYSPPTSVNKQRNWFQTTILIFLYFILVSIGLLIGLKLTFLVLPQLSVNPLPSLYDYLKSNLILNLPTILAISVLYATVSLRNYLELKISMFLAAIQLNVFFVTLNFLAVPDLSTSLYMTVLSSGIGIGLISHFITSQNDTHHAMEIVLTSRKALDVITHKLANLNQELSFIITLFLSEQTLKPILTQKISFLTDQIKVVRRTTTELDDIYTGLFSQPFLDSVKTEYPQDYI